MTLFNIVLLITITFVYYLRCKCAKKNVSKFGFKNTSKDKGFKYKKNDELLYVYTRRKDDIKIRIKCRVVDVKKNKKNNKNVYKVRALDGSGSILNIAENNLIKA